MSVCNICGREMLTADGCIGDPIPYADGKLFPRLKFYDPDGRKNGRCPDCNAKNGHYHHWGCDQEKCPRCGWQMISCDCVLEGEDE